MHGFRRVRMPLHSTCTTNDCSRITVHCPCFTSTPFSWFMSWIFPQSQRDASNQYYSLVLYPNTYHRNNMLHKPPVQADSDSEMEKIEPRLFRGLRIQKVSAPSLSSWISAFLTQSLTVTTSSFYRDGVRAECLGAGISSAHPDGNRHDTKSNSREYKAKKYITPGQWRSEAWQTRSELRC